jgi:uncharacterized protein YuzE
MKLKYYSETDSLYIDLRNKPGVDSKEVAEGVVLDFDESGYLVGIDIQHASQLLDLTRLEAEYVPLSEGTRGSTGVHREG